MKEQISADTKLQELIDMFENSIETLEAIEADKFNYYAVFSDTLLVGDIDKNGKGVIAHGLAPEPYSLDKAHYLSKNLTNGHGHAPIVMSQVQYIEKSIENLKKNLESLYNVKTINL
jgi:hypothetical protein